MLFEEVYRHDNIHQAKTVAAKRVETGIEIFTIDSIFIMLIPLMTHFFSK
jgi:hypothetical protein